MAPINTLSGLRKRYENDPARAAATAAADAEIDRTIARNDARNARMANMGRNPALEMNARRAAAGTYGKNTVGVTLSHDNGSNNSMREAAAYAAANPGLRRGSDVFGRNDREAAMQRNRDFIRSGRSSMFGPRPATTKGQNAEALRGLKRYEAETARRTNAAAAQNHRYELEQLAGLRRRELGLTERNNAAMAQNDRYKSLLKFKAAIANAQAAAGAAQPGNAETSRVLTEATQDTGRPPAEQVERELEPMPEGGLDDRREAYRQRGITWDGDPYVLGDGGEPLRTSPAGQQPVPREEAPAAPAPAQRPAPETPVQQPPAQARQTAPLPPTLPESAGEGLRRAPIPAEPGAGRPPAGTEADRLYQANRERYEVPSDMRGQYERGLNILRGSGKNPADYRPIVAKYPDGSEEIQWLSKKADLPRREGWRELNDDELAFFGLSRESVRTARSKPKVPRRMQHEMRRS